VVGLKFGEAAQDFRRKREDMNLQAVARRRWLACWRKATACLRETVGYGVKGSPCLCVILLIHSCISPLEVLRSKCLEFPSSASAQSAPCSSSSSPSASRPYWSVGIQDGKARSPQEPVKAVRDGQPVHDPAGVRFSQEIIGRIAGPDGRDAVAQVRAEQARAVVRVG